MLHEQDNTPINIGRNDPCPCGSGKKFKKCCIVNNSSSQHPILGMMERSKNTKVERLKSDIALHSKEDLSNSDFWNYIGMELGNLGEHEISLEAFKEALRYSDDNQHNLNIAVALKFLNKHQEALSYVEKGKDCDRYSVIKANILYDLEQYEEASALYKKAIHIEPDFDLPYEKLISLLNYKKDPDLEFWLDKAIAKPEVRRSPTIANAYCEFLYHEGRVEELEEIDWLDTVYVLERSDVINSDDAEMYLRLSKNWKQIAKCMTYNSSENLQDLLEVLENSNDCKSCSQIYVAMRIFAINGKHDLIDNSFELLCSDCKTTRVHDRKHAHADSYNTMGNYEASIKSYNELKEINALNAMGMYNLWWALDELGNGDEAIKIAEELTADEDKPNTFPLNFMHYNLGVICSKYGYIGKAEYNFRKQLSVTSRHPETIENLCFSLLLLKKYEESKECFDKYLSIIQEQANSLKIEMRDKSSFEDLINFKVIPKGENFSDLYEYAKSNSESVSYINDLVKRNQSNEIWIGCQSTIKPPKQDFEEILLGGFSESERAELVAQTKITKSGDYSAIINDLDNLDLSKMPDPAKVAFLGGVKAISDKNQFDYSPVIVSLAKAVEITLKGLVFEEFRSAIIASLDFEDVISKAKEFRKNQAARFIKFIERGEFIELGSMVYMIKLAKGKTGLKMELMRRFKSFILMELNGSLILEDQALQVLEDIVPRRNQSAHSDTASIQDAENILADVKKALNYIF